MTSDIGTGTGRSQEGLQDGNREAFRSQQFLSSQKERKILKQLGVDFNEDIELDPTTTIEEVQLPQGDASEAYDSVEDGDYHIEQVRAFAKDNLNFLAGLVLPTVFKFLFPPVLIGAWMLMCREVNKLRAFSQIALGIPRGHAKTTLMKIFVVYCILFTQKRFILLVGRTGPLAENILSDIVDMMDEQNIKVTFGDWRFALETDRTNLKKFSFHGRSIIIAAIGAGGSVRGLNLKNERPDVMIFEDIQDADDADSEVLSDSIYRWLLGTAMKAKSPNGCLFLFVGNMFPTKNSILRKLKDNPTWTKFISGAILEDGTALWEELRPLNELILELENDMAAGHPEIFFAEVMNDTESKINSNVDTSQIQRWPWPETDLPQGKVIIIDPAAGKKGSDPTTMSYFEIYDGKPGLKYIEEANLSPGATISKALILALKTGTKVIAIESNGYQATLLYWFEKTVEELHITGISCVPVHSTTVAKNSRITAMLRGLTANEIAIHNTVRGRVLKQVLDWKPLKRDNDDGILDTMCFIPRVMEMYEGLILSNEEIVIQDSDNEGTIEHAWAF